MVFKLGDNGSDKLNEFTYIGIRARIIELQQITDKVVDKKITNLVKKYISTYIQNRKVRRKNFKIKEHVCSSSGIVIVRIIFLFFIYP